jgi:PEP-CTERM motif
MDSPLVRTNRAITMMKSNVSLGIALVALVSSSGAEASYVVYSDGGTYTLSSASTNYYGVTNGSTFNVPGNTSITPTPEAQFGDAAIFSSSGNLNVSGGTITGGASLVPTAFAGSDAIYVTSPTGSTGSTLISAGQITGGAGITGGTGLALVDAGPTTINGGSITGGNSTLFEGQGGTGISYQGGSQLTINAGTFSGGSSLGPVAIPSASLFDGGNGNVEVLGGLFLSEIVVSFDNYNSRLDFFGTGLSYSNGILSGTLSNGNVIDQAVNISNASTVNINVVVNSNQTELSFVAVPATVPEPSSILMIALGLGGVALVARSRRG